MEISIKSNNLEKVIHDIIKNPLNYYIYIQLLITDIFVWFIVNASLTIRYYKNSYWWAINEIDHDVYQKVTNKSFVFGGNIANI